MCIRRSYAAVLAAVAALALAMVLPGTAAAQDNAPERFRFDGDIAFAEWWLGDERNTTVHVSGVDGDLQSGSRAPEEQQQVAVGVFQVFCDEDADELVERSFFTWEHAPVDIDPRLEAASVGRRAHAVRARVPGAGL